MKMTRRLIGLFWAAYLRFDRHDGSALAGYIAFSLLLSLFPFLIFAVALTGQLFGMADSVQVIENLFGLVPAHMGDAMTPAVEEVLHQQRGGLLTLSFATTFWIASSAVEAIRTGLDRAYGVRETRSFLVRRGTALLFVILGAFVAFFLGLTVVFSPFFVTLAQRLTHQTFERGTVMLSYGTGFVVFVFVLYLTHRFLPGKNMRNVTLWPGVLLTCLMLLSAALGFSLYLSYAPSYSLTYGTLAGVIVTLVFFYLVGTVLIYGAEVNATIDAERIERALRANL